MWNYKIHRVIHYTKAFNSKIPETTKMVINVVIKYHALMYIRTMGYHAHWTQQYKCPYMMQLRQHSRETKK